MDGTTALVSGGKDSIYAAYLADCQGWPVHELLVMQPEDPDSWMFHTPNLDLVRWQAEAWGKAVRTYPVPAGNAEAETLALEEAMRRGGPGPISVGAIASSFQWSRVLRAAHAVGRRVYAPLWRVEPQRVVGEEIAAGLDIRLVQVAAEPLEADWLGERLDADRARRLAALSRPPTSVHLAGEGGEYETLVVDAPFWRSRLSIDRAKIERRGAWARWTVEATHLVPHATSIGRTQMHA